MNNNAKQTGKKENAPELSVPRERDGPDDLTGFSTRPLINLEGHTVGRLGWRNSFADWAVDRMEAAVWIAREHRILWGNRAAQKLLKLTGESTWENCPDLPNWDEVASKSSVRRIGDYQLRCQNIGPYLLAEYSAQVAPAAEASLSLEQVATMVHEIRNPLAALSGYVEMAQMDAPEKDAGYYEKMMQEIDRLSRLTSDLMSISRLPVVYPHWAALDGLVDNAWLVALQGIRKRGRKSEIVLVKTYGSEQKIWADSDRLQQVLTNLIKNAVEAMSAVGTTVEVECRESATTAIIIVRDDGPGLPADVVDKVSVTRYTTKKSGSGLGLMIVRRIILAHGGSMAIRSGKHTAIELRLPRPR